MKTDTDKLVNEIDALIDELNIMRERLLSDEADKANEYIDGIVTGSEELRGNMERHALFSLLHNK